MDNIPILSFLVFFPLVSSLVIIALTRFQGRFSNNNSIFYCGITSSIITFVASLLLLPFFQKNASGFQFIEKLPLIESHNISYHLGIDGISLTMIVLTTFLIPICFFASLKSIKNRVKEYVVLFLLLESFVIGSFVAIDLVLFYIFFEAILIPMFLIIGIWGGKERNYAAYKFFLYTLIGSVLFLIALIYIISTHNTADIIILKSILPNIELETQKWLWLALFLSFAIKIPMFPVHTWQPNAHVQAPTAGSVILAGVLIKLGAYGFLRFSLPFFPDASLYFSGAVFVLSVVAIIYTSIIALVQTDIKKMIAYSSVAHMGFITMGIFTFNEQGLHGAIIQMISHGLVSSALFLCVGVIYDRMHTRQIAEFGGLAEKMPYYALFFMIFMLASVGLPGTSGFVGEFLTIVGAFKVSKIIAILSALGIILGACYMLWLYARVIFGKITNVKLSAISDVNKIEFTYLALISFLVILFGIYPAAILRYLDNPVSAIINLI